MKKCDYCGRENSAEAQFCRECGTEFIDPFAQPKPRNHDWLGYLIRYGSAIFVIVLFYFLSFGPVQRFLILTPAPAATTILASGQVTVVRTGRYPAFIGVLYYPAILLASSSGGNGIYSSYLELWNPR